MSLVTRLRAIRPPLPAALALGCFALALCQRPGQLIADTKVNLYVDPARFLHDVGSAWTPTGSLGHVFGGQYGGYLFPMAPWFAGGDALGIPMWVVHRLWLGLLLALAAWGVVLLLDALLTPRRGVAHAVAAVLFVVNPYVTVYANRTSVALLAYAALPWMLLAVYRGLRDPRGWAWPAVFALVLTSTGGGVNVAVTAWALLAPVLFVAYERLWGGVRAGALRPFLTRMAVANAVASAWWVVPLLVHTHYGLDFLPFTEQPGTIWGTTSLSESLRLMGFWTSYIGVGFGGRLIPFASHGDALLFNTAIVGAGLVVPALVLGSFALTGRWRYAPFFLGLTIAGLVAMTAGWPEGTPLRRGLTFTYNHVGALQFLRTTYKAGPLVALGLAALGGAGFGALWAWLGDRRWRLALPGRVAAAAVATGLVVIAAWPLTSGRAPESQLRFDVPKAYTELAGDLDRRGDGSRAMVFPGQLFAFYRWGGTIDAILPALSRHPVATRYIVPYADLRAVDLQWSVDALLSQQRVLPGQLRPLLDLMGVGDVVLAADGDRARSGETGAGEVAHQLAVSRGDGPPLPNPTPYGAHLRVPAAAGTLAPAARLPRLSRFGIATGGIVRVLPRGPLTVVDGSAAALTGLAAFGELRTDRPLAYAADLSRGELRAAGRAGGTFVISDANRRRAFVASRLRGNAGATLPPGQDVSEDGTMLDPFGPSRDPDEQTVQVLRGVKSLSSPFSPQVTQYPEHRPFAALDGDLSTAWLADRILTRDRHHLDVDFGRRRDVASIRLYPFSDGRAVVHAVKVNGRRFSVHRGWNVLPVGLRGVRTLRVAMASVQGPRTASSGAGGIRELRIPGVRVHELLRPPVDAERALRGADLSRSALSYLFERTTADAPFTRGRYAAPSGAGFLPRDARDPEAQLSRTFAPPAARRWSSQAWVSLSPQTPDDALDRLAGVIGGLRATSSSRFENTPRNRASGAFDGTRRRAWIGQWLAGRRTWLGWTVPRAATLRRLRLVAPSVRVRVPTRVRVRADGALSAPVDVGPDGLVTLQRPLRGRSFRLEILDARFAPGTPGRDRMRRAVGVGELRADGLTRLRVPRAAAGAAEVSAPCGSAVFTVGGHRVALSASASRAGFDAGLPLRAQSCGDVSLGAARTSLRGLDGAFVIDDLRLTSAAPLTVVPGGSGSRVLDEGDGSNGRRTGVTLLTDGPSWLVLGESFNTGWRARCDGKDLGAPRPMQGYANAWPISAGCSSVDFAWAPNRLLPIAYVVSLIGCLVLLGVLVRRRRTGTVWSHALDASERAVDPPPLAGFVLADALVRRPLRRALVAGAIAGAALGFVFALRAGVVLGPVVALVLWRGWGARKLTLLAFLLLLVGVPLAYVLGPGHDDGGYSTQYASDHVAGHWVAVGAVGLLIMALWRVLAAARRAGWSRDP